MTTSESTEVPVADGNPELKSIDLTGLKNVCPAFETGCPYVKVGTKEDMMKCPEFKNGCPYKESDSMEDVYKKLSQMPGFSLAGPHGKKLSETLVQVHEISKELERSMGKCPVFTEQGCPFKTVCSDGQLLIEKLDIQRWTEILQNSADSIIIEHAEAEGVLLSNELKSGTKKLHREVQNVHFIKEFLKGRIEKSWYKVLLANLYFTYSVLEEESGKHADHPLFRTVHYPKELNKTQLLEEDLEFYYGSDWREQIKVSPATKAYVERIRKVSCQDPSLLISHHYLRYLGDLSGGQILMKLVKKAFQLPKKGGVSFYEFEHIPDTKEFKNMYRSKLDKLCIGKEKSDEIVNEAVTAYQLNVKLFKEIDALAGFQEEPEKPIAHHGDGEVGDNQKPSDQCPIAALTKQAAPPKEQAAVNAAPVKPSDQCPIAALTKQAAPPKEQAAVNAAPVKPSDQCPIAALAKQAAPPKEQAAVNAAPVKPLMTNPLVWAFAAAILAVVLGLLAVKLY